MSPYEKHVHLAYACLLVALAMPSCPCCHRSLGKGVDEWLWRASTYFRGARIAEALTQKARA